MARPSQSSQSYSDLQPRPSDSFTYTPLKAEHDDPHADGVGSASLASSTSSTAKAKGKQSTPKAQGSLARGTACSTCRKRKLRCDGTRPHCQTCTRMGNTCVYGDPVHEKLLEQVRNLEGHNRSLEEELAYYKQRAGVLDGNDGGPALPTSHSNDNFAPDFGHSGPLPSTSQPFPSHLSYDALPQPSPDAPAHSRQNSIANLYANANPHQSYSTFPAAPEPPSSSLNVHTQQSVYPNAGFGGQGEGGPASGSPSTPHMHHPTGAPSYPPAQMLDPKLNGQQGGWSGVSSQATSKSYQSTIQTQWGSELPRLDLMLELSHLYFSTIHQHLPFLHRMRFLSSLHNPSSLTAAPSLSLIFSVLAIGAAYHDNPAVRAAGPAWESKARIVITQAMSNKETAGAPEPRLTVEMVQSLVILTILAMGASQHQRAFMTIGQAVRVSAMLGLHRMDEDRLFQRKDEQRGMARKPPKRIRPPALHALPQDGVLLEECRRTMAAVFVLDRLETSCVGWPTSIAIDDMRLLLPCDDHLFEESICTSVHNPLLWPDSFQVEHEVGPKAGNFAWLCRMAALGGQIQKETYRPTGVCTEGPFDRKPSDMDRPPPLEDVQSILDMDRRIDEMRRYIDLRLSEQRAEGNVNVPLSLTSMFINCELLLLHHLRIAELGLTHLPYDPSRAMILGSGEYSLQRALEGVSNVSRTIAQLAEMDNQRTTLHWSAVNSFSTFLPYVAYTFTFPAKWLLGDWDTYASATSRVGEGLAGGLVKAGQQLPTGDDLFGQGLDVVRVGIVDTMVEGLDRLGGRWEVGRKFAAIVRRDRDQLAERVVRRQSGWH